MSLRYSLIGRGGQVIVSAGASGGNVGQVAEDLLSRINSDVDDRKSYTADNVTFHYIVSSKIVFLCVSDEQFPVTQAYHYLQTLQNEWTRYYGSRGLSVTPTAANAEFGRKMASLMQLPNSSSSASSSSNFGRASPATGSVDKVEMVSRQIEDVKKQMVQNLDTVLARGEKIEELVASTSSLNTNASQFKRTATSLKRHMWWKNAKCWIILGVVLLVIAFAIALIICKGNFKTCGSKSKPKPAPAPHTPPTPVSPPITTPPPVMQPVPASVPITHPSAPPTAPPVHTAPVHVPVPVQIPISVPVPVFVPYHVPESAPTHVPVAVPSAPVHAPVAEPYNAPISALPHSEPTTVPTPINVPVAIPINAPFTTPIVPVHAPVAEPNNIPISVQPNSEPTTVPTPINVPVTIPINAPFTVPIEPAHAPVAAPNNVPISVQPHFEPVAVHVPITNEQPNAEPVHHTSPVPSVVTNTPEAHGPVSAQVPSEVTQPLYHITSPDKVLSPDHL